MEEPIKISTGKYTREGKVDIDGNVWSIVLPGAGTELRLSQAQRRIKLLDAKIEKGDATEGDLDRYDELEALMYESFKKMLSDGTPENKSVNDWIENTPTAIIVQVFDDIKEAANGNKEASQSS